ncbi:MAG: MGMT family protein [Firmicutes bacterium]|nr:MGMT family protein [Bacillota bacterium]
MEEIIAILKTDTLSYDFTNGGLRYLSLRARTNFPLLDLRALAGKQVGQGVEELIIKETGKFLSTGKHSMPLDLSSFTAFQRSVFDQVSAIEPGQITTYKGIAEMLGKPGAAQAVGNAIAKNPVSYFIPTHRVLPQRGIGICRSGAGHLRERLLEMEGHDLTKLRGNYLCPGKKCVYYD